ncbi:MAG TPA: aspartate aminotransferase family protein [Spirochaetia bacterium]|nr:aspartate aminotransferase family protein [Spirochaetia bacterium]
MKQHEDAAENMAQVEGLLIPCIRRWITDEPVLFVEGRGAVLKDSKGKEYLDLFNSHGTAAMIGYNHPAVVEAIKGQADKLYTLSADFASSPSMRLAERLTGILPQPLKRVFFASAGTEVVEAGLFLSKKHTKKYEIIALYGAFHGRTHGSRSLLGYAPFRKGMGPLLPGIVWLPNYYCYRCQLGLSYPKCELQCARMLENVLLYTSSGDAAVMVAEPVQGSSGNIPPPEGYFKEIKKILDRHNILLFIDEIYTALGTTGKLFCFEHYGVTPDLITMSKTLGGGIPISALVTSEKIAQSFAPPEPVNYFTTYGCNPLTAAAALASLNVILEEKLWERAARLGEYWLKGLKKLQDKHEIIGDVRGKGLLLALELVRDRKTKEPAKEEALKLRREAARRGLILLSGLGWLGNIVKMHPSAIMTEEQIDQALDIIDKSLQAVQS